MDRPWLAHYPEGVPIEIEPDLYTSIPALIDERVERFREQPAFSSFGTQISYAEYEQLASVFAAYFQNKLQLKKGDRIAIMLPNLIQYPVAMYAALRIGLVIVNVNPLYSPRELKHQLIDADIETIIIWSNVLHTLTEIISETGIQNVIVTQTDDLLEVDFPTQAKDEKLSAATGFLDVLSECSAMEWAPVSIDNNDLAFLQYTGGTTGLSKGAMLTHRNLIANVMQVHASSSPVVKDGEEIYMTALPLYHIYALTCNCLCCINVGGLNVLITDPRDLPGIIQEMTKWKFTFITGVNTLYNGLLHTPGFSELDFSTLKIASAGGMSVQTSVAEKWKSITGCTMIEGYGLSETSPVLTSNPFNITAHKGTIGIPISSTDVSIRDEDGNEVPTGESGELCARGPQIMKGYWRQDEATREVMTDDGFFRTGDIAFIDEQGFCTIIDRKKDMILVSGFNVFPNEVEDIVASMDDILECACIGVPDEKSGESVMLFVVRKPDTNPGEDEILAWCKKQLAAYKIPRRFEFVQDLPKSNVGKILRRELRDMISAR